MIIFSLVVTGNNGVGVVPNNGRVLVVVNGALVVTGGIEKFVSLVVVVGADVTTGDGSI